MSSGPWDLTPACALGYHGRTVVKSCALGLHFPLTGLHVSGQLLGAPSRPSHKDQTRTYFHIITITSDKPRAYNITISRSSISVQGESTLSLSWNQRALVKKPHLELHVASAALLTLRLGPHLNFFILRHQYRHPSTLQLPHLGFYVANGSGLSPSARGLMGKCFWGRKESGGTSPNRNLFSFSFLSFYFLCTYECFVHMYVYAPHVFWITLEAKRGPRVSWN